MKKIKNKFVFESFKNTFEFCEFLNRTQLTPNELVYLDKNSDTSDIEIIYMVEIKNDRF